MDPDQPTLGEIARTLYDVRQDIRAMRNEHVRADVYAVDRAGLVERLKDLDRDLAAQLATRAADRRLVAGSLLAAGLSIVVQFVQSR